MISPERVCKVLEGITMIEWKHKTLPFEELVYMFCHVARCTSCNHPDWEKMFEETEQEILEACASSTERATKALETETGLVLEICKLKEEVKEQWNSHYGIEIYFNDAFYWATSYSFSFICKNCSLSELTDKFLDWYRTSGEDILEKFDAVPYPFRDGLVAGEAALYFHENRLLAADLEDSINAFCGTTMEKNFDKQKEMESWENSDKKSY
jgi:hypothetical protein